MIPLQGGGLRLGALRGPGYQGPSGDELIAAHCDVISPSFFETLGVPLVTGRRFTAADGEGSPLVAIVNEAFAARAWPQPRRDRAGPPLQPVPFIYVPLAQQPMTELNLYVRSAPGRRPAAEIVRMIDAAEPTLPVIASQSFAEAIGIGLLPPSWG